VFENDATRKSLLQTKGVDQKRKEDKHEEDATINMVRSTWILEELKCNKGGQE